MKQTLKSTLLLLAVLLLGGLLPARAQVGEARSDLAIGVNGGINLSSVTFNPTIKTTNLMGMCGGLAIRYPCEKYFTAICALQMEINYAQRGWKEDIEDGSGNTYQRTTNYLEVLIAQQDLLQAELTMAEDKFNEIQGVINLYHALGGGKE